jgi:hypothetical protein
LQIGRDPKSLASADVADRKKQPISKYMFVR